MISAKMRAMFFPVCLPSIHLNASPQHPIIWFIRGCSDVVSGYWKIGIPRLWGPSIECKGNLARKSLWHHDSCQWPIGKWIRRTRTNNFSQIFSLARWVRWMTSLLTVLHFGISLSANSGRQKRRSWRKLSHSTNRNACTKFQFW